MKGMKLVFEAHYKGDEIPISEKGAIISDIAATLDQLHEVEEVIIVESHDARIEY